MFQGRKIITLLISLLGAAFLWLYVVTNVTPEMNFHVGGILVSIDGMSVLEERGLVITEKSDDNLDLDIKTSRDNLSKLNASTIRINADISKIREPGKYTLNCAVTFPDTVRNVEILRKSEITVTVERLQKKTFDIKLKPTGDGKNGYSVDVANAELDPAQVVVTGLSDEVEKISEVVAPYDISELEETETASVTLLFLDENGGELLFTEHTSFSITQSQVTIPVLLMRTIPLKVNLIPGGGVAINNATVQLDPAEIHVTGPADAIKLLDDALEDGELVVKTVDLSTISDNELEQLIPLDLPENVINQSGVDKIRMTISLTGVSTDTIDISDIRLKNIPSELDVKLSTLSVSVTVRGRTDEIREIQQSKNNGFYVVVDLADYTMQTGAFTVSGKVFNDAHPSISVSEAVDIGVIIQQPNEPDE